VHVRVEVSRLLGCGAALVAVAALAAASDTGAGVLGAGAAAVCDERLGRWVERRWPASQRPAAATTDGVNVYVLFEGDDGTLSMSAVRAFTEAGTARRVACRPVPGGLPRQAEATGPPEPSAACAAARRASGTR